MTTPNSLHRVVFVFVGFLSIALFFLWVLGGRESHCVVTVASSLPSSEMQQRFQARIEQLELLDSKSLRVEQIRKLPMYEPGMVPVSMVVHSGSFSLGRLPLADIVFLGSEDREESISIDPAVVFSDLAFRPSSELALEWFARDSEHVYLRETDVDRHVRLVKLQQDNLRFTSTAVDGQEGSLISYTYTVRHSGFRRLYGKLFERSCESSAQARLEWICNQLEAE
jgi:hypothetical protein